MSRSNESDGKKLWKGENEKRCPSSSSSSKSDDGDAPPLPPRNTGDGIAVVGRNRRGLLKGGSEAPSDVFYEYLGVDETDDMVDAFESSNWSGQLCRVSADMKLLRLKKLNCDDSDILLILDVPARQKKETTSDEPKRRLEYAFATTSSDGRRPEACGRKSTRNRYEAQVSGGVARTLEEPGSEWRRRQQPRSDAAANDASEDDRSSKSVAYGECVDRAKKSISIKRDADASQFEPVRKKSKKFVAAETDQSECVSKMKAVEVLASTDDINPRTCLLRDGYPTVSTWSELKTSKTPTVVEEPSKDVPRTFFACRSDVAASFRTLLGEDNIKAVSSNGGDTSTGDVNDDELNSSNNDDSDSKAKKKNRCALCRKKVGLTGFECRCGGLYCGMHRYSDKHNCTFDYRQLGAQEIRRNNPVVIGEKIQKI